MIKDYLYAIGKHLPASEKNDILNEIESAIYDYLENKFGKKEYTNDEIESAILNMGNPQKVAYLYTEKERYLISPIYLDVYFLVTKIALFGISIAFAVIAVLTSIDPPGTSILGLLTGFLGNIWQVGLMMVGMVTIIFAAISKYGIKEDDFKEEYEDWSIKDLEKAPADINIVKTSTIIIESIFIILFLTFVNSLSFGFGFKFNGFFVALNVNVFSNFTIWINIVLIFNLILNVFLLINREWTTLNRILSIISDILGLSILGILAFNPNILDFSKIPVLEPSVIESLKLATSIGFRIGFLAILVVTLIEIFKHLKAILNKDKEI